MIENKKIRMLLGLLMLQGFYSLAFLFYFILNLPYDNPVYYLFTFAIYWYMWMPAVLLIIQNYYLLTKVFKYAKVD